MEKIYPMMYKLNNYFDTINPDHYPNKAMDRIKKAEAANSIKSRAEILDL